MNNVTTLDQAPAQPIPQDAPIKTWSPVLLGQYPTSREEVVAAQAALDALDVAAKPRWVAQRVVTLLTHYFMAEVDPAAMGVMAKDWTRELDGLPEWAIDQACAWWLSRNNPKRRSKPLPGDISARAHHEASAIKLGRQQIEFYERYGDNPPAFIRGAG